ncbi:hypothetical protein OPV22_008506 [Ensete ventricosum]|uniref:Uncharacterized protein n=1 Tax=Ensete ventricosum TaxID=4639 RepID=A0AAV8REW2_ENSVE|nr:hypothetical protein OPV22_008506 [Ensete ventricosum]
MKDGDDLLPSFEATGGVASAIRVSSAADAGLFGKGRYKVWALTAILLLAFWSMVTGTVTLRWSAGDLNRLDRGHDAPIHSDLDALEMEEREKVVRHMWDVYAHNHRIRLPRFWQEAFEAAYEELAGDDPAARDGAIAEIARMSVRMVDLEDPVRNTKAAETNRNQRVGGGELSMRPYFNLTSIAACPRYAIEMKLPASHPFVSSVLPMVLKP